MKCSERVVRQANAVSERRRKKRRAENSEKLQASVKRWRARTASDILADHDQIFLNLARNLFERGL